MNKIMVAMSGGVDSSVTAYLLQQEGIECIGCTMKLYDTEELDHTVCQRSTSGIKTCCSEEDVRDAKSVAYKLNMNHYTFNYKGDFRKYVIDDFIDNYVNGRTPNPCIRCNRYMKFGQLINRAKELGYDGIATGHYARIEETANGYVLRKALDLSKDQSYVLYNLSQDQLAHIRFPLGELNKGQVRAIAEEQGFVNAAKHDSQDICFVPDGDYAAMIERYSDRTFPEGDFIDTEGNVLGRHKGIIHYTIGQRRGLGIASDGRLYVLKIDVENNQVVLGQDEDLYERGVILRDMHWISGSDIPAEVRCSAKIRYRMTEQPATLYYHGDGRVKLIFDEPQRAATPGQTAVFYDGDIVLGGAIIDM